MFALLSLHRLTVFAFGLVISVKTSTLLSLHRLTVFAFGLVISVKTSTLLSLHRLTVFAFGRVISVKTSRRLVWFQRDQWDMKHRTVEKTANGVLNLHCDLDLKHNNPVVIFLRTICHIMM